MALDEPQDSNSNDQLGTGLTVLAFLIPLAGAIIYFIKKDKEPASAKTACNAALAGFAVGIVLNLVITMVSK